MLSWSIHTVADGRIFFSFMPEYYHLGFSDSSVDKESTCSVGNPGLIPGLRRSPGEGIGYPLQNCWASLVAQLVKNLPAMWETWVQTLGWEDPLEKGKATHSSILAWRIPWTVVHGVTKSQAQYYSIVSICVYTYTCVCTHVHKTFSYPFMHQWTQVVFKS